MTESTDVKDQIAKSMSAVNEQFVNTVLDVLSCGQSHRWVGKPLPAGESYGGAQVTRENPCADLPPTQWSPFRDKK